MSEVEAESGIDIGLHVTGNIAVACDPEWLQGAYRTFQTIDIDDCHLMSGNEKCPIMSIEGITGGLWANRDVYVDITDSVHAYARAAKKRGADTIKHNRVLELHWRGGYWYVVTEKALSKLKIS